MTQDWFIAMLFVLLHLAFALVSRLAHGSWLAPGPFFTGLWSLFIMLPMLLAAEFYVWWGAIFVIILAGLAVNTGSLLGLYVGRGIGDCVAVSDVKKHQMTSPLVLLVVLATLCGLASILIVLIDLGQGIRTFFSFSDLVEAAAQNSILRYQQDYSPPFLARILTAGVYLAPLAGGMLFAIDKRRSRRLLALLPIVPAVLWAVVMTTKASLLYCIIFWLATYFAAWTWSGKTSDYHIRWGAIWAGCIAIVTLAAFMIIVQMMRYGDIDLEGAVYVIVVLKTAFLGYLAAFSTWLYTYLDQIGSATFGAYSFGGVYELLGFGGRELGVFGDQSVVIGESTSNIYTVFRPIIEDFTFAGALMVLALLGFVSGVSFVRLRQGNIASIAGVSLFYSFSSWSHVTSLFAYNTILLAFVLWWVTLITLRQIYAD